MLIQPRNSSLLRARRIKNTETVILIFNGLKVPNYVYCVQVIYRCTLYKRQIDTCGQVCHRQDLCRAPSTKVCDHCGHLPSDNPHVCTQPVCVLCGEAHRTGDHECRHRYQLLTWCAVIVSTVADESRPSSKQPPQRPARFLP
ncbi:hypothetical protein HPB51_012296 [Rhipicephalus microplus]|uniref:Uncharacterized protein n=1 Tax=Rhipicephalus microplus TaxID=6941 RepID=A0A9J6E8L9_RHIMP|nr:hypothetical protein HPB51_012296 [Rhipicephalus microplus]